MKKIIEILAVVFLFVIFLSSCKKEDTKEMAQPIKKEVKIFFKSATITSQKSGPVTMQVKSGDTLSCGVNVNAIAWLEDANGNPVRANWSIDNLSSDNPSGFFTEMQPDRYAVDQTSLLFPQYGVYEVYIWNEDVRTSFFVNVFGIPGKFGDDKDILRIEKKNLTVVGGSGAKHRFLFVYYKFSNTNWLDRWPDAYILTSNNLTGSAVHRGMAKWEFSEKNRDVYYYFIIDLENPANIGDYYIVEFFIAQTAGGVGDNNAVRSSWGNGLGSIKFFMP